MSGDRPVVAAFDVDGTLTVRDCVRPFLVELAGWNGIVRAIGRRPLASLRGGATRDRDQLKEVVVGGVFRGRTVAAVESLGKRFAEKVHERWMRTDTVERLRWHQRHGHLTVLVSASLAPYLRPLGGLLAVDDVLCTDVVHAGDVYADVLDGENCRAAEKQRRLDTWLTSHGLDEAEVWAYGDSSGDAQLLARADCPVHVKHIVIGAVPAGHAA